MPIHLCSDLSTDIYCFIVAEDSGFEQAYKNKLNAFIDNLYIQV